MEKEKEIKQLANKICLEYSKRATINNEFLLLEFV